MNHAMTEIDIERREQIAPGIQRITAHQLPDLDSQEIDT
jgi:hypothetical protein